MLVKTWEFESQQRDEAEFRSGWQRTITKMLPYKNSIWGEAILHYNLPGMNACVKFSDFTS